MVAGGHAKSAGEGAERCTGGSGGEGELEITILALHTALTQDSGRRKEEAGGGCGIAPQSMMIHQTLDTVCAFIDDIPELETRS